MKKVNENDFDYRNGDSGVKYLMRGPDIDWGIILIKPGDSMAPKAHAHKEVYETFYFSEGSGKMIINGEPHDSPQGTAFLIEPKEMHNIKNDSDSLLKVIFIKGDYKPDDKIE